MGEFFGKLQKLGRALMLPVAVLPVAALMLRLGAGDVLNIPFVMSAGDAIFTNLALLFAIGVAVGLSKDNAGAAAMAGAVGYFVLVNGTKAINPDINMGVLGGIIAGATAAMLYNKYHDIKLPEFLGFFGGKRFVPIATSLATILIALIFGFVWPPIQNGIHFIGEWIVGAGAIGTFVFGTLNRLLIPFGLHHVLNSIVWFIFGEYGGATGDLHRFFAGDPQAGIFMTGFFPIFMFGLPAVALAMYTTARLENRKAIAGILFSVAFTAFLTGITEPIEFMFIFLAPVLFALHAVFTGVALALTQAMGIRHGFGFSAGAIDYFLNMGLATNGWLIIPVGIVFAIVYYFLFVAMINKMNLPTPGRLDKEGGDIDEAIARLGMDGLAKEYIAKLGGKSNIIAIDACITRIRLTVDNPSIINDDDLKSLGASGVIRPSKKNMQVVVGTKADIISDAIKKQLK